MVATTSSAVILRPRAWSSSMIVIESLAPRSAEMRSASSSSQSISALLVILLINFLKNPAMGIYVVKLCSC